MITKAEFIRRVQEGASVAAAAVFMGSTTLAPGMAVAETRQPIMGLDRDLTPGQQALAQRVLNTSLSHQAGIQAFAEVGPPTFYEQFTEYWRCCGNPDQPFLNWI